MHQRPGELLLIRPGHAVEDRAGQGKGAAIDQGQEPQLRAPPWKRPSAAASARVPAASSGLPIREPSAPWRWKPADGRRWVSADDAALTRQRGHSS